MFLFFMFSVQLVAREDNYTEPTGWVDSVFYSLTPAQRIAQLIMVEAGSDPGEQVEIEALIRAYNIGGVVFRQGGPVRQAILTNQLQEAALTPLLVAVNAGRGLGALPDSTIYFPHQLALEAVSDNCLIYDMASNLASQLRRLGVHINMVSLPHPEVHPRFDHYSRGQVRAPVSESTGNYIRGMHDNGVLTGGINIRENDYTSLLTAEYTPVLTGYPENSAPAWLGTQNFSTLLFSEDLQSVKSAGNISGNAWSEGRAGVMALLSGKEVLLFPADVGKTLAAIEKAIDEGMLSQEMIDERCRRILAAKYHVGLSRPLQVDTFNLMGDLNDITSEILKRRITAASLTLVENRNDLVPLKRLDTLRIASVSIGSGAINHFQETLSLYSPVRHYAVSKYSSLEALTRIITELDQFNLVIVGVDDADVRRSRQYGISPQTSWFVRRLSDRNTVVLTLFNSPEGLAFFDDLSNLSTLLVAYEDTRLTQEYSAQLIFGGIPASGRLPVSPLARYPEGSGHATAGLQRLRYSIPEEAGLDSRKLSGIDEIVKNAIDQKATPGAQVLVARRGMVVYHKAFGHHTYTGENPVSLTDLYDLASITKIAASVPAIMNLKEAGKLDIYQTLGHYLPGLETTNKNDLVMKDVLTHQARLQSWIPFIYDTFESLIPGEELFSRRVSARYPYMLGDYMYMNRHYRLSNHQFNDELTGDFTVRVADRMFMNRSYIDSMYRRIDDSPLRTSNNYFYSDLGYYYLKSIIEQACLSPLDVFLEKTLYRPLGATRLTYLPLEKYSPYEIVPTENDMIFRRQLLHGHVHDAGTGMIGGVGGHAGLFSNANDLAKLMQLYLQNGEYGGIRFFNPETIMEFTSAPNSQNGNRRGIGFDKPEMTSSRSPAARSASRESYGHSGFTGTMAWVDPREEIVYIFLSNRVHPDQFNIKLTELNVRTRIQQLIYDSILQ